MAEAMLRVLILAVVLAAGLPAVAQTPASDPPPFSTATSNSEQAPSQDNAQAAQTAQPSTPEEPKKDEKKKGKLSRLKDHVKDHFSDGCVGAGTAGGCWGDDKGKKDGKQESAEKNPPPPRSDEGDPEFSSSRESRLKAPTTSRK